MRRRNLWFAVALSGALSVGGAVPALADVNVILHVGVDGEAPVDQTVTVPTSDADADVRLGNVDATTTGTLPGACVTGVGLSVREPAPLARESGIGVACVNASS